MLVILRENIENLGHVGDVVKVSDGYARNFLLPRNKVVVAEEKNIAAIEHHKRLLEKTKQAQKATALELAKKLESFSCNIFRKVGEHDKLYGSVNAGDIFEVLNKAGFSVSKRLIHLDSPIKALGTHTVSVKLVPEVSAKLKVVVAKEE